MSLADGNEQGTIARAGALSGAESSDEKYSSLTRKESSSIERTRLRHDGLAKTTQPRRRHAE